MESKRFKLNKEDLKKWGNNTAIFLAPAILVFLLIVKNGGTQEQALTAVYLWLLNVTIDLLKKFIANK